MQRTEGRAQMTDDEREAALAELRELQKRIAEGTHELLNILAILKGEVDLAVDRAQQSLRAFYRKYPDFTEVL